MLQNLTDLDEHATILSLACTTLRGGMPCPMNLEWSNIQQGEGGEQGDVMMPMLFSWGQHRAWAIAEQLQEKEKLFAFLDVIFVVCNLDKVGHVHQLLQRGCGSMHASRCIWARAGATGARHDQIGPVESEHKILLERISAVNEFAVRLVAVDFLCRLSSKLHPP